MDRLPTRPASGRRRERVTAAVSLALVTGFSLACWLALGKPAPHTGPAPGRARSPAGAAESAPPVPEPGARDPEPVPPAARPVPHSAPRTPHRSRAYLPLVEPYESIPDLDPESPEGELAARLDALVRAESDAARRRRLATLRVRLDYLVTRGAEWTLEEFRRQLEEVLAGRDPFAAGTGAQLRGYHAVNDDSCQAYSLALPEGYDAAKRYPLVLELHCHGWGDWYRPFQGYASPLAGAIVAAPHGRGSCDYLLIAEDDVLAVIDAVSADFPVDGSRVYVTGWSMGGTGSFHLPGRYPDRFAASAPKAGNADFTAWEEAWKEDRQRRPTPLAGVRDFLRWKTAPVTYAENFLHVPIAIDHGERDSTNPVAHSRSMAGRLRQLGYDRVRFRAGEGGHGWGASTAERFEWMKQFSRPESPERVRLKTGDYRHGSAYWVEITRIADRMKMAEVDVEVHTGTSAPVPDQSVTVRSAENVEEFVLKQLAPHAKVYFRSGEAGRLLRTPEPLPGRLLLRRDGDSFVACPEPPPPAALRKRRGLEGPIFDAFREPFLVVVGTVAEDPFEREVVREEAARWCRQWRRRFQVWPPCKDDDEVTDADIAARNLVLFGGPQANSVTARVNARLPARIEGKKVVVGDREYSGDDLGLKLCYPNPLNPGRLVVLQASTTWRGMWQMTHRFGNWFDWMPLDNLDWFDFCVFDDRSAEFETMLDVGFFDEDWKPAPAGRWGGVPAWRARAAPRTYPRHRSAPDRPVVRLDEIWPRQIDTAKGPLHIGRSFAGGELRIAGRPQAHGLGQWIESAVSYDIAGRYRSLRVSYGVDGAGQERISAARSATERPRFEIWGDGRLLACDRNVKFGDAPRRFEVDVTGVKGLTLRVLRQSPEGWLYGPVAWGEPTLSKAAPNPEP